MVFKLSYASILLNLPLAIVAFFITSRARAVRSFTYVAAFSVFLMILDQVDLTNFQYATTSSTILGPAVAGIIAGCCEIVTENPDELCDAIIHQLHHTATRFPAQGIFSGREKTVLVCVVNPTQVAELTKLVGGYPGSFVSLSAVSTVLGNFKRLDSHGKPEVRLLDDGVISKK